MKVCCRGNSSCVDINTSTFSLHCRDSFESINYIYWEIIIFNTKITNHRNLRQFCKKSFAAWMDPKFAFVCLINLEKHFVSSTT